MLLRVVRMSYRLIASFSLGIALCLSSVSHAEDVQPQDVTKNNDITISKGGIQVKLIQPTYQNGVLSTSKGGTIQGKDFFLQGRDIRYTRRQEDGKLIHRIDAHGDLFFQYKMRPYTGERIEIDLVSKTSTIYNGCSSIGQWFVGGKIIELVPDGSGTIYDGYFTTSENELNDWSIHGKDVDLTKNGSVKARSVKFQFMKLPILWVPHLSTNLNEDRRAPFKYHFRWGSGMGPRVGIVYDLFRKKYVKCDLVFDLILRKGIGAGAIVRYDNPDRKESLYSYNYVAHDVTSFDPKEHPRERYRFQGMANKQLTQDKLKFQLSYDKLSDSAMRGDYGDELDYGRVLPTQAFLKQKTDTWMALLNTRVRVNPFQTIKQELPLFSFNTHPMQLGETKCILDNRLSAGLLHYKYAERIHHVRDFHSTRAELSQKLFRPFAFSRFIATPEAGYTVISYNRSPRHGAELLAIGKFGFDLRTRYTTHLHHGSYSLQPYAQYQYYTEPTSKPNKHYIFDLDDGLGRLNTVRFGLKNFLFTEGDNFLKRLTLDLYARAFFNTPTIANSIPRIYADASWKPNGYMTYSIGSAWDTKRNYIDHFNIATRFTVNEDVAFVLEYRQRSPYAWRKVDPENFILDSFHSEKRLRRSQVSDRRNTFLTEVFVRFTPTFAVKLQTRHGWRRIHHHPYTEFEIDFMKLVRGALQVNFSFQHRVTEKRFGDNRFSVECSLGRKPPSESTSFTKFGQGNYDN
jgi:hypothetical protein